MMATLFIGYLSVNSFRMRPFQLGAAVAFVAWALSQLQRCLNLLSREEL